MLPHVSRFPAHRGVPLESLKAIQIFLERTRASEWHFRENRGRCSQQLFQDQFSTLLAMTT